MQLGMGFVAFIAWIYISDLNAAFVARGRCPASKFPCISVTTRETFTEQMVPNADMLNEGMTGMHSSDYF